MPRLVKQYISSSIISAPHSSVIMKGWLTIVSLTCVFLQRTDVCTSGYGLLNNKAETFSHLLLYMFWAVLGGRIDKLKCVCVYTARQLSSISHREPVLHWENKKVWGTGSLSRLHYPDPEKKNCDTLGTLFWITWFYYIVCVYGHTVNNCVLISTQG